MVRDENRQHEKALKMLKTLVLKHEYDLYILKKKTLKSEDSLKILIPVWCISMYVASWKDRALYDFSWAALC